VTGKADFTEEEWQLVVEGPATAGMILATADSGGTFRETWALAKAYSDARAHHGQSELLDTIVSSKPDFDKHGAHSGTELKDQGLERLRETAAVLAQKAAPDELDAYRTFAVDVATKVASAHEEHGERISPAEQAALDEVKAALAGSAAGS